jgi:hypothetical protein
VPGLSDTIALVRIQGSYCELNSTARNLLFVIGDHTLLLSNAPGVQGRKPAVPMIRLLLCSPTFLTPMEDNYRDEDMG